MSLMEAKAAKRGGMFAALGDLIGVGTKLTSAFA
jgi:hypothetical protein